MSQAQAVAPRPNILLVVTDDQRYDGMDVMERTSRIFGRGTTYPNAYVTTPLCCPSRSSILTGQYAHNHGVFDNHLPIELNPGTTWPEALKRSGYKTALIGKYLNKWPADKTPPGFDKFSYPDRKDPKEEIQMARKANRFIDATNDPWAMILAPHSPHAPFTPARRFADVGAFEKNPAQRERDLSDKPALAAYDDVPKHHQKRRVRLWKDQRRELLTVDRMVGRVFRDLGPERKRTLAFFISDNGYLFGEHSITGKNLPYIDSIRVPFYVRGPGVAADTTNPGLVANIDIAPTIYEATGVEPLVVQDGQPLFTPPNRDWLLLEGPVGYRWDAYLSADRHYVRWPNGIVEDYDLASDPWELEASGAPDETIEAVLDGGLSCAGSNCP